MTEVLVNLESYFIEVDLGKANRTNDPEKYIREKCIESISKHAIDGEIYLDTYEVEE